MGVSSEKFYQKIKTIDSIKLTDDEVTQFTSIMVYIFFQCQVSSGCCVLKITKIG